MKMRKLCAAILAAGLVLSLCTLSFASEGGLSPDLPGAAKQSGDSPEEQLEQQEEDLTTDPEAPKEDPSADPETPTEDPSTDPETPKEDPSTDPEAPKEDPSTDPEIPKEDPSTDPEPPKEDPSTDPETPKEDPSTDPETPKEDPSTDPEAPKEDPSTDPETPKEDPSTDPEAPTEDPSTDPEAPKDDPLTAPEIPENEILPEEKPPIIEVAIPASGQVIINPYCLKVEKDGEKITDQVISSTLYLQNRSEVAVSVNAVSTGKIPAGSGITLVSAPPESEAAEKELFLYAEFLPARDDAYKPKWSGEYSDASNQLMVMPESLSKEGVMILAPAGQEDSFGAMRLFGSAVVVPDEEWVAEDRIETTFVYTFDAVEE